MVKRNADAYGHEIYAYHQGERAIEIIERDDGWIGASPWLPAVYFREFEDWPLHQQAAMQLVRGRVLDIGCGAGRHSLYLQEQGFDVLGVDNSPLAVEVCRLRGLKNVLNLSITQLSANLGVFDTILMLGNNFGLMGSPRRARWLLRRFKKMTSQHVQIIAESRDPYQTSNPIHLQYHQFNRQRGRLGGQLRIRVRFQDKISPWFDYWIASRAELAATLDGTGWTIERFLDAEDSRFIAVIRKNNA